MGYDNRMISAGVSARVAGLPRGERFHRTAPGIYLIVIWHSLESLS